MKRPPVERKERGACGQGCAELQYAAVFRVWLALAVLCLGTARGAAPSYSAAGILNAASYTPGPFAPNSIVTIYGSNLATATHGITKDDIQNNMLPKELNGTRVYVDGRPAPLFYVSEIQINFVLPGTISFFEPPPMVQVVTNGNSGPLIPLSMAPAAPALFVMNGGYAIATHGDSPAVVTPDAPAHGGEIAVVYCTGLGKTQHDPAPGELPNYTSPLLNPGALKVTLDGVPVDAGAIQYAGLTATSAALYQINLVLPDDTPADPEIRVYVGDQASPAGVKLAVR